MAFLVIACSEWDVALSLERGPDLAVEGLLVRFDRQEGARRPPAPGTTEKRSGGVQGIRLDQHAFQLQGAQQLFEGRTLTGFPGVRGRLGQGDAERPGIDRHLGDKPVTALLSRHCRPPQGPAVAHQLLQTLCTVWDLVNHPGLEHLAEYLQVGLVQQVEQGGIRRPALEMQAQRFVERLTMPPRKGLEITGAAAAAQDPQQRHQQQEPLGIAHPTAVAAIRNDLEEADQGIRNGLIDGGRAGFGRWQGALPLTKPDARRPAKGYADRLLGGPDRDPWQHARGSIILELRAAA
jgi:hypothetical protein